jgi:PAS domain S-box-containing protein
MTALGQAEDALLKAGALQRAILNSANFSSIATDANGIIQIFNVGAERMLGYLATEVVNKITPADISDPQEGILRAQALSAELGTRIMPGFEALVFKASRGLEDIYELTYIRKDGSRFPAVVSVTALRDAQNAIIGYLLIGTDNTARKLAEEVRAKYVLDVMQTEVSEAAILAITDITGKIEQVNDNFVRISQYSREELIGQDHRLLNSGLHPKEFMRDLWATIANGRVWRNEIRNRAKDGSFYWVDSAITPILNEHGKPVKYMAVRFDVTARKLADEKLRTASQYARSLIEASLDPLVTISPEGKITDVNEGSIKVTGVTRENLIGTDFSNYFTEPEKAREGYQQVFAQGFVTDYPLTIRHENGHLTDVLYNASVYKDVAGNVLGVFAAARDVTAQKQAEEALFQAGALQKAIFDSANFSSIATDAKGVIQIFNVGAERMLGYTAAEVMDKITPADISDPEEVIARAKALSVELGTPITPGFEALVFKASRGIEDIYELTYIRKDESRFPAVVSVTALRDTQDVIIGYLLIGTDNTARKMAEEALLQAGALQRAIFNSANFSSIATDARGVIQIFNVGAERMLGYAAAEVMNKITPADISDPQEVIARAQALSLELETPIKPGFEALVFKASRGIEDIYELTYIRKDGSRFPAVVSITALRDTQDVIIGYLLIGTDNTARKLAEEALLQAGALQRAIFNSANFSSIATDARGVIQIFNVGAERMLGYTAAEVMNKITPADISDPDELIARATALSLELETPIAPGFEALVFKASRGIEDIYELTYFRKDGSHFPAVVSVTALRDAQSVIIGYLLIGTDNTARKAIEAEKAKLDQSLHEANEELRRFTYIVGHDLRSPLVNIMGFSGELEAWQKQVFQRLETLRNRLTTEEGGDQDEALRADGRESMSFIKSSIAKMDRLINALLSLSREGQRQFHPQLIDMSQLLQSNVDALAYQAQAANAKIRIDVLPAITSDRLALEQVFSNLIDNALKYLRTDVAGRIQVGASESHGAITYEVRDNGRGIHTNDRERIFDLFRRSGAQDRPGEGIGLAHARALVRRLGGSIHVESELHQGTVFTVTLPKKWHQPASEIAE